MDSKPPPSLAEKWLSRLRENRFVAAAIFLATCVAGISSFGDSILKASKAAVELIKISSPSQPASQAASQATTTISIGTVNAGPVIGLIDNSNRNTNIYQTSPDYRGQSNDNVPLTNDNNKSPKSEPTVSHNTASSEKSVTIKQQAAPTVEVKVFPLLPPLPQNLITLVLDLGFKSELYYRSNDQTLIASLRADLDYIAGAISVPAPAVRLPVDDDKFSNFRYASEYYDATIEKIHKTYGSRARKIFHIGSRSARLLIADENKKNTDVLKNQLEIAAIVSGVPPDIAKNWSISPTVWYQNISSYLKQQEPLPPIRAHQ